jgi:hypothetical protein
VRRRILVLALAGMATVAAAACAKGDGRALPPPDPDRTTTSSSVPEIQPPTGELGPFTLQSTAFAEGAPVPDRLTCTAADAPMSPDLSWTGTPPEAASLAIVVRDRNQGGFVHWIVYGIDPFVLGIGEGGIPENAVEGPNGAGSLGWLALCPTAGDGPHTYEFVLLALPAPPEIAAGATSEQVAAQLEAAAYERAVLTGTATAG